MPITECQLHQTRVSFDAERGRVTIRRPHATLQEVQAGCTFRHGAQLSERSLLLGGAAHLDERGDQQRLVITVDHGLVRSEWSLALVKGEHVLVIGVRLVEPTVALQIETISAFQVQWVHTHLEVELPTARWWVFPSSAWDRPGTRPLVGAPDPEDCAAIAYDIGGAYAPSGRALTLAHLLPGQWMNRIDASEESLQVVSTIGIRLPARGTMSSDPLRLDLERPITTALAAIGEQHRGRHQAADSAQHWGWNAWDYFTDKVVEADVAHAVSVIASHDWMRPSIRFVVVDDFWQDRVGDWQPGTRYGSIHRSIAAIRDAGFTPGIWTAPFFADRTSQLLTEHPEFALKLRDGQLYSHCMGCDPPWGDRCYLDPTHPGVVAHIFALYRRLYDWGLRYFKTDFLTNAIASEFPGESQKYRGQIVYHNPSYGLVRAHRTCMEAIRSAIGPDSFWLGCGTHYSSGAGLMDATRISADMRPNYSSLLSCAKSAIFNFHLHGGAFLIDPDFAVFRGRETSLPGMLEIPAEGTKPYDRYRGDTGPTFNLIEARLWASVLIMSGGVLMLSDRLDGLNDQGLAIVRTLLEHGGGTSAVPIDIFASLPSIWRKRHRQSTYLLVVNWSDSATVVSLPEGSELPEGAALTEIWSGATTRYARGLSISLPAHGHQMLRAAD